MSVKFTVHNRFQQEGGRRAARRSLVVSAQCKQHNTMLLFSARIQGHLIKT